MQQGDFQKFASAMTAVAELYGKQLSSGAVALWWQALERFEFAQVSRALHTHTQDPKDGQFMPKPADLIRHLEGTATDAAQLAWGKAYEAMQRVGAYTDVVFDDPVIHAVIDDLGGWPKVCRGETKDLSYLQHRFCESYQAYRNRAKSGAGLEYPRMLMGDRSPDDVFASKGLPPPKPAVVGDVEKAKLVWRGGKVGGKAAISFSDKAAKAVMALANGCAQRNAA